MKIINKLFFIGFITLFIFININVFADVDMEEGLYARYTFEDYNYSSYIYDTQNNAEKLLEYGNPTLHYSDVLGIGMYYHFDGDDYLKDNTGDGLIADGGFSLDIEKLTICTVVKTDYTSTAPDAHFTVSETARDGYFYRWTSGDNHTYLRLRDSSATIQEFSSTQELNNTGWSLLTACWQSGDNGFVRMWHNSTMVLNYTGSLIIPQIEGRFEIMRCQYFGFYGIGDVGFLEIYTQPVNDEWVTEKYNSVFGIEVNVTSKWVDKSDMLFEELLFGTGFWFGLLLVIAILQIVCSIVPRFSSLGGIFSFLLFIAYVMNMDLNGWHTFGIMLMAVNGLYLFIQSSE
ncbi:hypothetical protein ES702_01425 [subsurface metagenome]